MNDAVALLYVANAVLLIALTDRLRSVRPLAQAFVLLASTGIVGHVVGQSSAIANAEARAILFASAPAMCTWSVLRTCDSTVRKRWFVLTALATVAAANLVHGGERIVTFLGQTVPEWQRNYGIFWGGVWSVWAVVSIVGWWRLYRAPVGMAHILAGLVAASVIPEAFGIVGWAANAEWYVITCATDLLFAGVVCTVSCHALWRTRSS